MSKKKTLLISLLFSLSLALGQIKIGNAHEDIHPSSLLELESESQVFVLTSLSQEEMEQIKPRSGALVFNRTKNCLFFYHHSWIPLCELSPDIIESLWSGLSHHTHELEAHSHDSIPSHTHAIPTHTHEDLVNHSHETPPPHTHEDLELLLHALQNSETTSITTELDIPAHTHEIPDHTHEIPDHEHDIGTHEHELVAHQHDIPTHEHPIPPSGGMSHTLSLNPLDSLNLFQFRTATPGALWYAKDSVHLSEIKNATGTALGIFWDDKNARLGVGTTKPTNKMHVAGEIRSQGFSNSNGSKNEPSYSFKSDSNTGMYRAAADQLAFSTKGHEVLRMTKLGGVVIGKTTANALLDVNGPIATKIDIIDQATATIEDHHSTVILGTSCVQVVLPEPNSENKGRIYVLKNGSGISLPLNINFAGPLEINATQSSLPTGITQLQSDGLRWQQMN